MKPSGRQCFALLFTCIGTLSGLVVATAGQSRANSPAAKTGAFYTGHYRNLFREDGHSQREIDKKVSTAFDQLSHGDPNSESIYFVAGRN
jgi:hypothetical protein